MCVLGVVEWGYILQSVEDGIVVVWWDGEGAVCVCWVSVSEDISYGQMRKK